MHQHLLLMGSNWADEEQVTVEVDARAIESYKPNAPGEMDTHFKRSDKHFAFLIATESGDRVKIKTTKNGATFMTDMDVRDCRTKDEVTNHALKSTADAHTDHSLIAYCSNVRHKDIWTEFAQNWVKNGASTDTAKLKEEFDAVLEKHVGYEINIFMDNLQGSKVHLEFTPSDGDGSKAKKTTKTIQQKSGGAVFAVWSVPKEAGKIKYFAGSVSGEFDLEKVSFLEKPENGANVYFLVNVLHGRSDYIWRDVQKEFPHKTTQSHQYWDFEKFAWKQEALHDLFEKVREKPFELSRFESATEGKNSQWKLILIIVVLVLLIGFAVYWFFCKSDGDESDLDSEAQTQEMPSQMNKKDNTPKAPAEGAAQLDALLQSAENNQPAGSVADGTVGPAVSSRA